MDDLANMRDFEGSEDGGDEAGLKSLLGFTEDETNEGDETTTVSSTGKKKKGRPQGTSKKDSIRGAKKNETNQKVIEEAPKSKPKKSRRNQVVNGHNYCAPCKKWLPIEMFPNGSAQCAADRKALQSLRNAAIAQGQMAWFDEMFNDEDKLAKVVKNYHARISNSTNKNARSAGAFPILTYVEEVRQEIALILEGLAEMMPL